MLVSLYKSSTDTEGVIINYKKILKGIQEGKWADQVQNLLSLRERSSEDYSKSKKLLPSTTFAGTFSARNMDSLVDYSHMIVLDIDKLSEAQVNHYKMAFTEDQFIHACFISPSRAGIKILVRLESAPEHHLAAFLSLEKYFKETYAIAIDPSGKDISRLCYVSHDHDLYMNMESVPFVFDVSAIEINTKRGFDDRPDRFKGHVLSKDAKYAFKVCEMWTQRNHQYVDGNRNNYIHVLACNMNRCGVDEKDAELMIYNNYSDLPSKELHTTVHSAYKNESEHNSVDVYEIEKGNIPNDEPDEELSTSEQIVFEDTLELMRAGVKQSRISKLIKFFASGKLEFTEEEISRLMNMAKEKFKTENEADSHQTESATDALMEAVSQYRDSGGVSTLVPEFDETLGGGLMPGLLYGAIGDGGTFKSIFAHCIGSEKAKGDGLILYLNGEMSRLQLLDRVVNKELGKELIYGLKNREITEEELPNIISELKEVLGDNFQIVNNSGWTQDSIVQTVNNIELKFNKKVQLIIVDGLSQMEDAKKDEIKSAIFNSGELKEVAKRTNTSVIVLVHVSGNPPKHHRDTSKLIRGGTKLINNMDAMFCTSLLVDETSSNIENGDILYRTGIFYLRLIDKRGSGLVLNKIIQVHRPLRLEPLPIDPSAMEVKTS